MGSEESFQLKLENAKTRRTERGKTNNKNTQIKKRNIKNAEKPINEKLENVITTKTRNSKREISKTQRSGRGKK